MYTLSEAKNNNEVFTTFDVNTVEDGKKLYKATNTTKRLSEIIGQTIKIVDVIAEPVTTKDKETDEIKSLTRMIIITDSSDAYSTCSTGIFNSLKKIFSIFGMPSDWSEPLMVKVSQINNSNNRIFTLDIV